MEIRIRRLDKELELPRYNNPTDAALDLRSRESQVLRPMEKKLIMTGIQVQIPTSHVGLIWDRSGLAAKHSIHTLAGVIDSGYRGEIGVVMINLGNQDFAVERGMRIAQMVVQPVLNVDVKEVEDLDDSDRGKRGFGSSGLM